MKKLLILLLAAVMLLAMLAGCVKIPTEDIANTIHPHPTVSETLMEAAHDVEGMSTNAMPKK